MYLSSETIVRIIFLVISIVLIFYGIIHVVLHFLDVPLFREKWAIELGIILVVTAIVLVVISFIFI